MGGAFGHPAVEAPIREGNVYTGSLKKQQPQYVMNRVIVPASGSSRGIIFFLFIYF